MSTTHTFIHNMLSQSINISVSKAGLVGLVVWFYINVSAYYKINQITQCKITVYIHSRVVKIRPFFSTWVIRLAGPWLHKLLSLGGTDIMIMKYDINIIIFDIWYTIYDVCYIMYDIWNMIYDRYMTYDIWYMIYA